METKDTVKKESRTFVIVNPDQTESGSFKGVQPRQAAVKAINDNGTGTKEKPVIIRLRERGTMKIHVFSGYTYMEKAPANKPKWLPDIIKKSHVEKLGVEEVTITERKDQGVVITETKRESNTPIKGSGL